MVIGADLRSAPMDVDDEVAVAVGIVDATTACEAPSLLVFRSNVVFTIGSTRVLSWSNKGTYATFSSNRLRFVESEEDSTNGAKHRIRCVTTQYKS